jgi:hypothetical protein
MKKAKIIFLYCLPALLALALILHGYYVRNQDVSDTILHYKEWVDTDIAEGKEIKADPNQTMVVRRLIAFLATKAMTAKKVGANEKATDITAGPDKTHLTYEECKKKQSISAGCIKRYLTSIWISNAWLISSMVLLPYILFGSRLAFSDRIILSAEDRIRSISFNWWMRFLVACVMVIGWIYLLNPTGRGESTIEQFLIRVDLSQNESLPLYIKAQGITPVIAGFLGWYLYFLTYFFSKLVHHDVVSGRVYSLMFKKFLFTYGIAMIIPSVQVSQAALPMIQTGQEQSILMFLIGYFPLSAFSILKEAGLKLGGNFKSDSGYLTELPGISRWQVMRLEEEGIDNMAALAYADQGRLRASLLSMATVIDLWIDIAQLYVVLGQEGYEKIRRRCKSASGFLAMQADSEFTKFLSSEGIGDAKEIAQLIQRTFAGKLLPYSA